MSLKELDVVALTVDLPERGLRSGDAGTVVQVYSAGAVEVEFVMASGHTQALVTLTIDKIRPLGARSPLSARHPDTA
jgi:hypothetical protein